MTEGITIELSHVEAKLVTELLKRTFHAGRKSNSTWASQRKSEVAASILDRMDNQT